MKVWRSLSFTAHLPHELWENAVHVSRQGPISVCPWSHLEESYNLKSVYPHSTSQRFLVKVNLQFSSVQFSHSVISNSLQTHRLQHSLSIANSQSLLRLTSIESVMPSNHLILCPPLLLPPSILPSTRIFSNESVLRIRYWSLSQSIGVSASASVLPMNIQDWFPLGWTGLLI